MEATAHCGTWSGSRYQALRPLGEGSYGAVWEALDTRTNERVAIKELRRTTPNAIADFKREFRALQDLHHQNLVGLKEMFESDGRLCIVMDLVDGDDLVGFVRGNAADASNDNGACFQEDRLRQALLGIARGLSALHAHGVLHRDLKPSNVRIARDGRAVLLDFGLAITLASAGQSVQHGFAGTAAYMAPEQAAGVKCTAAADWYAFGSCCYELLTGRAPFEGDHPLQILFAKQQRLPELPRSVAKGVPADLEALCMHLLDPSPAARANAHDVFATLAREVLSHPPTAALSIAPTAEAAELFRGRDAELHHLEVAVDDVRKGDLRIVLVEGESGVGKSALVSHFVTKLVRESSQVITLKSRCYENELLAYKAFDGAMDELSRVLKRLSQKKRAPEMPQHAPLLAQVFPVLRGVPGLRDAAEHDGPADPTARRLQAFGALREILSALSSERLVVLVIDDLQWADPESFRMLRALATASEAPPILVLATVRSREELEPALANEVEVIRGWRSSRTISLLGLPRPDAEELSRQLMGGAAHPSWLTMIANESKGHPLFIAELVRYAGSREFGSRSVISLDAALRARFSELDSDARRLFDMLAVAARPTATHVLANALSLAPERASAVATSLLSAKLVRSRRGGELACAHDRIRSVAFEQIPKAALPGLHLRLARALSQMSGADPADLARHWDAAGETNAASEAYERAGAVALDTLAFERAAQVFARAIDLADPGDLSRRVDLMVMRGHALARAGRSAEAATSYAAAAAGCTGERSVRLRMLTANQRLQGAQFEEGTREARAVLAELNITLPRGTGSAIARLALERVLLTFTKTDGAEGRVSAAEQLELDALIELGSSLTWVELLPAATLSARHLRRSLRSSLPGHVTRALTEEAIMRNLQRPDDTAPVEALLGRCRAILEEHPDRTAEGRLLSAEGAIALVRWEYVKAEELLLRAAHVIEAHCPGEPFVLTNVRMNLCGVRFSLGKHRELAADSERWMTEACERNDRFARAALVGLGMGYARHLMADDVDGAVDEIREAMSVLPKEPFGLAQLGELLGLVQCLLYRGGADALNFLLGEKARLSRAFLLRTRLGKELINSFHAAAAISAAVVKEGVERANALKLARKHASGLRRLGSPYALAWGAGFEAQIAVLMGQEERALAAASDASRRTLEARHFAPCFEALRGLIEDPNRADSVAASALEAYAERGWKNPVRAITLTAPALFALGIEAKAKPKKREDVRGHYRVLGPLGLGGFGAVFEAVDTRTQRPVALKELTRADPSALARFKREFRALQAVTHPNLVRLESLFESEGKWFIAMEFIEGQAPSAFVRGPRGIDEARVRSLLLQLSRGLTALHEAGLVHCDVSPSNVRVTEGGRVVLLDFGFVSANGSRAHGEIEAGSAHYMAPEQVDGAEPKPSADAYALGVVMYELMTGRLPIEGVSAFDIMLQKRNARPLSFQDHGVFVAADLEALCLSLLEPEPSKRATLFDVIVRLSPTSQISATQGTSSQIPRVIGREQEIETLDRALSEVRERKKPKLVLVEGPSGIGKSVLVSEWTKKITRRDPRVRVLEGRCYESELIPFKMFDGALDDLARHLAALSHEDVTLLIPPRIAALREMFPVLERVDAIHEVPRRAHAGDPAVRRGQAFLALKSLLSGLSADAPIVLSIDDVHWADAESLRLLSALLEGEDPPPLVIVCTCRAKEELDADALDIRNALLAREETIPLAVSGLSPAHAGQLVSMLHSHALDADWIERMVAQTAGHPLLIQELARDVHEGSSREPRATSLRQALMQRIGRLPRESRRLLLLLSVFGRPIGMHVLTRAFGEGFASGERHAELVRDKLARFRRGDQLECAHDGVREACLASLAADELAETAALLAQALESEPDIDVGERARLYDLGGHAALASRDYEAAGAQALLVLAFMRAAALFERAIALLGQGHESRRMGLLTQRAHALSRAGHTKLAAETYDAASKLAEGDERLRLRAWAAQHWLHGAELETGMSAASTLLAELGIPLAEGTAGAIARIAWERARLSIPKQIALDDKPVPARDKLALDVLFDLSAPIGYVKMLHSVALYPRHLREALRASDACHIARGLAQEATFRAMQRADVTRNYMPLLEHARKLAQQSGDPSVRAFVLYCEGNAHMFRWQPASAAQLLGQALELLQNEHQGDPWLVNNVRMLMASAWNQLGQDQRFASHMQAWILEAQERDDRFARVTLLGPALGHLRHLIADQPHLAEPEMREAAAPWDPYPFGVIHLGEFLCRTNTATYCGGSRALEVLEQVEKSFSSSLLARSKLGKMAWCMMKTGAYLHHVADVSGAKRDEAVRQVESWASRLRKLNLPWGNALAADAFAQLSLLRGDAEQALMNAREARARFGACENVQLHYLDYFEGVVLGGDEGRERCARALEGLSERGWKAPLAHVRWRLPILTLR